MTVEEALEIVEKILDYDRLNKVQELVFRQSWEGQSYPEIATSRGYEPEYIKQVGFHLWQSLSQALGLKVTKNNFQSILKRYAQKTQVQVIASVPALSTADVMNDRHLEAARLKNVSEIGEATTYLPIPHQDWGDAIDVSAFYGRTIELLELEQWIVQERCRLVAILGMGGIGKTALCVKLVQRIGEHFEYVIWRSLRNAPLVEEILTTLLKFLSNEQETNLPESVDGKILRLLEYLRSSRCLLVLDNAESILQSGEYAGQYRAGYEDYGQLLRCVGETRHQSAIVITSREKPKSFAAKEGVTLPVRSFQLFGLPTAAGREIFQARGSCWASEDEWQVLIEHYAGNPLAFKMVAPAIQDFFDGSISKFLELLKQGTFVFDDIRNLLERQFNRLSDLEKELMYWLALNREPVSFLQLQADLVYKVGDSEILEALASLQRRSLVEKSSVGFTQQPVVMEYMTERLINRFYEEIAFFSSYALIQAQTKDYVGQTRIRFMLQPVIDQLLATFCRMH